MGGEFEGRPGIITKNPRSSLNCLLFQIRVAVQDIAPVGPQAPLVENQHHRFRKRKVACSKRLPGHCTDLASWFRVSLVVPEC